MCIRDSLLSVAALVFRPVQAVAADPAPDLTRQPTLYVVGYAHLDTEWRWEYPQVIDEYIVHTMRDNFCLLYTSRHQAADIVGMNAVRVLFRSDREQDALGVHLRR